ncbi:hypothetical protein FKM82_005465 [Ascaphus truei]
MQPPPQTGPPTTCAPPRMGMTSNAYWRKRGPTPASVTTAPVQPVTDPFAFVRKTPQGMLPGNAPKGNLVVMPSPSPSLYPQPVPVTSSAVGDYSHGMQTSVPGSVLQPVAKGGMYTNVSAPSAMTGHLASSMPTTLSTDPGHCHTAVPSFQNAPSGLENAYVHPYGGVPVQNRPQSRQGMPADLNNSSNVAPPISSCAPAPSQQATGHWGLIQSAPPTSVPNYYSLSTQNSAYNAPYSSPPYLEVSNLHPQSNLLPNEPQHQTVQHRTAPVHLPVASGEKNVSHNSSFQFSSAFQTDYIHNQNPGQSNNWFNQPYQEQLHPPLPKPNLVQSGTRSAISENTHHEDSGQVSSHILTGADSGSISMFFKGDDAENVEILSRDKQRVSDKSDFDAAYCHSIGYQGSGPPPLPQQTIANIQSQTPVTVHSQAPSSQPFLSQNISSYYDPQASWKHDVYAIVDNTSIEADVGTEPQYDNVENIEVLPNEPPNTSLFPVSVNSDVFRHVPVPGPSLPKCDTNHTKGGPVLETLDALAHPVRRDSVSSSYSNISHRSLPSSTRPQELVGTFIQKESGKLDNDLSTNFFKQVDSSPMAGDAGVQSMSQNGFHGNSSQPPTPSPPKPTGIFQTSPNSSFEPVRSHGVGIKPTEVDQAKVVGEVREGHKVLTVASHGAAMPTASPGNLEQPPDNLETIVTDKLNTRACTTNSGNLFQSVGGSSFETISLLLDKRPSSRAYGSNKKCESPATTLWAQDELPNFGGNVLLAPAAPALYVPPKPQTEIIQPPEDGLLQQPNRLELVKLQPSPEEHISSENLENPPKIGDEEHLHSQASSGYASLLSSPPTESLPTQPMLIAQPNKSYNLAQPINFSMSLPNQNKNINSVQDQGVGDKPIQTTQAPPSNFLSEENPSPSLIHTGSALNIPVFPHLSSNNSAPSSDLFPEPSSNQPSHLLRHNPSNQIPLNLATESHKTVKVESLPPDAANKSTAPVSVQTGTHLPVGFGNAMLPPPTSNSNTLSRTNSQAETAFALDFTVPRAPTNHSANSGMPITSRPVFPIQSVNAQNIQPGAGINNQGFYHQQSALENSQQGPESSYQYMTPAPQPIPLVSSAQQIIPGRMSVQPPQQMGAQMPSTQHPTGPGPPYSSTSEPVPKYGTSEQPAYTLQPVPAQTTAYAEQPRPPASQTPQQGLGPSADPYYYYSHYGAYPPQYQQPYQPPDPRAPPFYYQDPYAAYYPTSGNYGNAAFVDSGKYRYPEPERPSSRSSHCSDRPPSRQGESASGDWGNQNNYKADYRNQYDYGDPARWDRYPGSYDPGYRDPRSNYWNYMYGNREDAYQRKDPYTYTNRYSVYDDPWQYDPRFVSGFDDENEPQRDLAKDDFDRRSVHSEQSARSLHSSQSVHSRRSSFSSHSQHSQIYKSQQDLTATAYDAQMQNPSLPNDYSYGIYPNNYGSQPALDSYLYGYQNQTEWPHAEPVPSRSLTPEKFASPHVCARFGPGGHLIKVLPNLPSDGQPTLVEIHTMEIILQNTHEQEQMRAFPGPLVKDETHKVDVINYAQNRAKECSRDESLLDQESASLLWDFVMLLCRQNGTVVGTDIAELLLQDHKTVWLPGKSPNEANLIDFSNEPVGQEEESVVSQLSFLTDMLPSTGNSLEKETERFRELLLFGRKKDALESAMKHGLWGHALLLASKMDSRTHARVMTRFANSLPINDPLQTVYQLMSGRMPAAATCCGDEKWGDWRPHIAMVLSNLTNNLDVPSRTITTMGDTLASRGLLDAAHFCYLMAQVGFGVYTKKTAKIVLIGSNHTLPFAKFASNEAIQRTEAYEYAQSLGSRAFSLPNIQVFKFIYACRLAEHGLSAQAFHYCEVISRAILKHPSYYSPVLVSQLLEVSSHLRFFDPQLKEKPEQELFIEPPWLLHLRHVDMQIKKGTIVYDTGRSTPQQYTCSTPSSEQDHVSQSDGIGAVQEMAFGNENPLLENLLPSMPSDQGFQLMPPGPENHQSIDHVSAIAEPSYPAAPPSLVSKPGFSPPVTAPGFVQYSGAPTYPAPGVDPLTPPPQATDFAPQEQWNQDPGMQRIAQNSPPKTTFREPGFDFYGEMAKMAPGQRSRTVSQSSTHMRRTRTTSESSSHSIGSGRRNSAITQPSPPPPAIPEQDRQEARKEPKTQSSSQGSGKSWFPLKISWLLRKGKNEAHLPDDRNKSIVWDGKKQRWVNLDEPEGEEIKPPPPPPPGIPKGSQSAAFGPGGPPNSSINKFSIRAAGTRGRYVDVLNPSGSRPTNSVLPPADLFAPLAPMAIPTNLFVPNAVSEEQQPAEASGPEMVPASDQAHYDNPSHTQFLNSAPLPPGSDYPASNQDEPQSGEASSNLAPTSGPPAGAVPFYNPSQFAQQPSGGARPGRLGQRKYPSLK